MQIAWTTILIIALLLPGVFFFIGLASGNRYSSEIVKSSAIGEVGLAIFLAILIHLIAWSALRLLGFDLASSADSLAEYGGGISHERFVGSAVHLLPLVFSYILVTSLIGLGLGLLTSNAVSRGYLSFLVTHKWLNQVRQSMKSGLVTAYVMTNTAQKDKVLMYKGVLAEFLQNKEGLFEYVVLRSCSSYFMTFDDVSPYTGMHRELFSHHRERPADAWDFLHIEGRNETEAGARALQDALDEQISLSRSMPHAPTGRDAPTD